MASNGTNLFAALGSTSDRRSSSPSNGSDDGSASPHRNDDMGEVARDDDLGELGLPGNDFYLQDDQAWQPRPQRPTVAQADSNMPNAPEMPTGADTVVEAQAGSSNAPASKGKDKSMTDQLEILSLREQYASQLPVDARDASNLGRPSSRSAPGGPKLNYEFVRKLPANAFYDERRGYYPSKVPYLDVTVDARSVHQDYRGSDRPKMYIPKQGRISTDQQQWHQSRNVIVQTTDSDGKKQAFGSFGKDNDQIRSFFINDSQMPAIGISVCKGVNAKGEWDEECMFIFGNAIDPDMEPERTPGGMTFVHKSTKAEDFDLPAACSTFDAAKAQEIRDKYLAGGGLWETRICLMTQEELVDPLSNRPRWTGTTAASLRGAVTAIDRMEANRRNIVEAALLQAKKISIFRMDFGIHMDLNQQQMDYFNAVFHLSIHFGPLWFYVGQKPNKRIDEKDFPWNETVHPRFLTTRWKVGMNSDNIVVNWEADKWASLSTPIVWPKDVYYSAVLCLGMDRERMGQRELLAQMTDEAGGNLRAYFLPHPEEFGTFVISLVIGDTRVVEITGEDEDGQGEAQETTEIVESPVQFKLPLDTRIEVRVTEGLAPGVAPPRYVGSVIEEPMVKQKSARLYGIVHGPNGVFDKDQSVKIEFEVVDDTTSLDRAKEALLSIRDPQKRKIGVDIAEVLLGSERQVTDANRHNTVTADQRKRFNDVGLIARPGRPLNTLQSECVRWSLKDGNNGLVVIQGPPGTGKTVTGMCIVKAMGGELKRRVLVCGPSNNSVLNAKNEFKEATKSTGDNRKPGNNFLHFHNVYSTVDKIVTMGTSHKKSDDESVDAAESSMFSLLSALGDQKLGEEDALEDGFSRKKLAAIKSMAGDSKHHLHEDARRWWHLFFRLKGTPDFTADAKSELKKLDKKLQEYFMEGIYVVFCTLTQARNPILMEYFKPDVVVVDEAALSTTPELAIPLVTFRESVKEVVLMGDDQQQDPIVTSAGKNEAYRILSISPFQRLAEMTRQGLGEYRMIMLTEQYRMHPDIGALVSKLSYQGKLTHARSTEIQDELQIAADEFFARFKPVWNGRKRMAVDVSGPLHGSRVYEGTFSQQNETEASLIVGLVKALVDFKPQNGRQIRGSDIKIVTPYTGQRHNIQNKLATVASLRPKDNDNLAITVEVWSTAQSQSREGMIEIVSLVKNNQKNALDISWIAQQKPLNVMLSRAKRRQIIFGNWTPWSQMYVDNDEGLSKNRKRAAFHTVVKDFFDLDDIMTMSHFRDGLVGGPLSGGKPFKQTIVRTLAQPPFAGDKRGASSSGAADGPAKKPNYRGGRGGRGGGRGRGSDNRGGRGGSRVGA